jgi:O-antigen/teichoic acid export membrane protein
MAWWFQCLRGIALYIIAFLASPWFCRFYFEGKPEMLTIHTMPELVALVRLAFLTVLINGFCSIRTCVLEKELKFGKLVFLTQGSSILGTIITIIIAFAMKNVWALVIGFTSTAFVRCILSYVLCPYYPRFSFDRYSFQNLSKFGRGVLGLPIMTYIAFNIDVLVAGRLVPGDLLGMYGMAMALADIPRQLFGISVGPLLLPVFSRKQDDKPSLCNTLIRITKVMALITIPYTALMVVCSKTIMSVLYGVQYSVVAVPFSLLCVHILLITQGQILGTIFFSIGQPEKHRTFVTIRALILIALMYPAIQFFGLTGAAVTILLADFIAFCLQVAIIRKEIGLQVSKYAISWLPGLAMVVPIFVTIPILQTLKPDMPVMYLAGGVISYLLSCLAGLVMMRRFEILSQRLVGSSTFVESVNKVKEQDA